jgi:hypothetical protein
MRLGTLILLAGLLVLGLGVSMPAGETSRSYVCHSAWDCPGEVTTYEPNQAKLPITAIGGFLTVVGTAGWVGAYSADQSRRREE